jgi:plasmid stabilization system protein ParE
VSLVRFHRAATEDAEAAVRWYDERVPGLGKDFRMELLGAVDRIVRAPLLWPPSAYDRRTRRSLLPRFPYAVVDVVAPDTSIIVAAVAHARRRPLYWVKRL